MNPPIYEQDYVLKQEELLYTEMELQSINGGTAIIWDDNNQKSQVSSIIPSIKKKNWTISEINQTKEDLRIFEEIIINETAAIGPDYLDDDYSDDEEITTSTNSAGSLTATSAKQNSSSFLSLKSPETFVRTSSHNWYSDEIGSPRTPWLNSDGGLTPVLRTSSEPNKESSKSRSSSSSSSVGSSIDKLSNVSSFNQTIVSNTSPKKHTRRSSKSRHKLNRISEKVLSMYSELRSKQEQIVKVIETSANPGQNEMTLENVTMKTLLELNDTLFSVLKLAGNIIPSASSPGRVERIVDKKSTDDNEYLPSMHSIVYMLRRGGNKNEIARAINQLVQLCNRQEDDKLVAVKAMRNCGVLQILLQALTKYSEWPDIEVLISKVISVLVTYEDDWQLLTKSAFDILSSLYTLQLKTSNKVNRLSSSGIMSSDEFDSSGSVSVSRINSSDGETEKSNDKDCGALIAAALAKLTLVLCSEWSDQYDMSNNNSSVNSNTNVSNVQDGRPRRRSGSHSGGISSGDGNLDKLLKTILNIIVAVCDRHKPYFTHFQNIFSPTIVPVGTSVGFGLSAMSTSVSFGMNSLNATSVNYYGAPSSLTSTSDSPTDDSMGIVEDAKPTQTTTIPPVDNTAVLCSIAIANLSEIPKCRLPLVQGGALSLLRNWMEWILAIHNERKGNSMIAGNSENENELLVNCTAAIMHIVGGNAPESGKYRYYENSATSNRATSSPYFAYNSNYNNLGGNDYNTGLIDARFLAEGLPNVIMNFIVQTIEEKVSQSSDNETDNVESVFRSEIPSSVSVYLSQTIFQLSSRPQNRSHLQQVNAPFALVLLFVYYTRFIIDNDAITYQLDETTRKRSNANQIITPSSIIDNEVRPSEQVIKPKRASEFTRLTRRNLLQQQISTQQKSVKGTLNNENGLFNSIDINDICIITTCLDGLSDYLVDVVISQPCISLDQYATDKKSAFGIPVDPGRKTTLLELMCSRPVMNGISKIAQSFPRCNARLACLRVILALTQWQLSLDTLINEYVLDPLVLICSEADEFKLKNDNTSNGGVDGQVNGTEKNKNVILNPVKTPTSERLDYNPERLYSLAVEETMLVCVALANICHTKKEYANRLFNTGLLHIMLQFIDSDNYEISRQAVRCVGAMSSVISSNSESQNKVVYSTSNAQKMYKDALDALSRALNSNSSVVQRDAINGIANLAMEENLRDDIVKGPLKQIVGILNNYHLDRDMRAAAELVLKNIGFVGGLHDVETCNFDIQLLSDWFNLKMSLQPQVLAKRVIERWIADELFKDNVTTGNCFSDSPNYSGYKDISMGSSYEEEADSIEECLNRFSLSDPRPKETNSNHFSMYGYMTGMSSPLGHQSPIMSLAASLPFGLLQKQLSDSVMKLLPFTSKKSIESSYVDDDRRSSFGSSKSNGISRNSTPPPSSIDISGGASTKSSVSSMGSTPYTKVIGDKQVYEGVDRPPVMVTHLLDLFYPSKLHQIFFLGLFSLRNESELFDDAAVPSYATVARANDPSEVFSQVQLPSPYDVSTLYLPSRSYSFRLLGRVIQKLVETNIGNESSSDAEKNWSLSFQDADTASDETFHESLLTILRKCPQILSLSFNSNSINNNCADAKMGHLAGNIPHTVRFLYFSGCLSSESVQAACILIKRNNAAYITSNGNATPNVKQYPAKGLLGLGITHTSLTPEDVDHVAELLRDIDDDSVNMTEDDKIKSETASHTEVVTKNGIRFLDLSDNKLEDKSLAVLLKASTQGPLEALELGGNYLTSTKSPFIDNLKLLCNPTSGSANCLKHLGLSRCSISIGNVSNILKGLINNKTLTSLDLSNNNISFNTQESRTLLRSFLSSNHGLRIFDLSYNKITQDTTTSIYLGILKNQIILLMPLAGNVQVLMQQQFTLIQDQLLENRRRYKRTIVELNKQAQMVRSESLETDIYKGLFGEIELGNDQAITSVNAIAPSIATSVTIPRADVEAVILLDGAPVTVPYPAAEALNRPVIASKVNTFGSNDSNNIISSSNSVVGLDYLSEDHPQSSGFTHRSIPLRRYPSSNDYRNVLNVFFSAPLAWRDAHHTLHPLTTLDYRSERDALVQVFREVHRDLSVSFDFATTSSLINAVQMGCRAIHFSGHGHPQGLYFENGRSGLHVLKMEELRHILKPGDNKLDFVFVSACYSKATGEAFIQAGVKHVVCVKVDEMIQDSAAISFTRAFYIALLSGKSVKSSFQIAKEALVMSPYVCNSVVEGEKFILLPPTDDDDTLHDESIFDAGMVTEWPEHPAQCYMGPKYKNQGLDSMDIEALHPRPIFSQYLPLPLPDFEGREVDMYRVITNLMRGRLVTLFADNGMGKTAVTTAVCNYIDDRNMIEDGVIYIKAVGVTTQLKFVEKLKHALSTGPKQIMNRYNAILSASREELDYNYGNTDSEMLHHMEKAGADNRSRLRDEEENIISCLSTLKVLIVIDHIDDLVPKPDDDDDDDNRVDFKLFLSMLLDQCGGVKVLVTCTDTLEFRFRNKRVGVTEYGVDLGPLSLLNSVKLFVRRSRATTLQPAAVKTAFIRALVPPKQSHVTIKSKDLMPKAADIFSIFENGHPAKIVKIACECSNESVLEILQRCEVSNIDSIFKPSV